VCPGGLNDYACPSNAMTVWLNRSDVRLQAGTCTLMKPCLLLTEIRIHTGFYEAAPAPMVTCVCASGRALSRLIRRAAGGRSGMRCTFSLTIASTAPTTESA
jgi:hypothetical protein